MSPSVLLTGLLCVYVFYFKPPPPPSTALQPSEKNKPFSWDELWPPWSEDKLSGQLGQPTEGNFLRVAPPIGSKRKNVFLQLYVQGAGSGQMTWKRCTNRMSGWWCLYKCSLAVSGNPPFSLVPISLLSFLLLRNQMNDVPTGQGRSGPRRKIQGEGQRQRKGETCLNKKKRKKKRGMRSQGILTD